ncbi:hypothetical protein FAM18133_01386 [Lacticaseibacillus paracasei]|uniref:DUF1642 domain-containing protein n=1 Tax=Lacticaseibacillus paracasei TaxID=1597 RepID=UPI000FF28B03|nr:DUF1642 domain-containing protein [Lacticaseibacillus paracasei]MCT3345054.1 DUF1642 domain-containing protein [Lacticaseibacillus paracasei]RND74935.1 hypothetical protein FAM18133_01386 [Lacticaseibacillus paracasei]
MSEEKLYAVKNDEGLLLLYSEQGAPLWRVWGEMFADKPAAERAAHAENGHVFTVIEEPKKVVLSEKQAGIVEKARVSDIPATYISDHTDAYNCEESLLINAYVNGYTVEKEKKYNVKVPHTKDVWYFKESEAYLLTICPADDKKLRGKFTEAEIEHYGLQDCEKEEVTDDGK